jgi:hypothetical protein
MKTRYLALGGLVLGLSISFLMGFQRTDSGDPIQPAVASDPTVPWQLIGTITASNSTLAVTARSKKAVEDLPDANTAVWSVPNDARLAEICYAVKANAETDVVECWLTPSSFLKDGTTGSPYTLGFIDTLTGGQQTGLNTNVFVDTIVSTDSTGILTNTIVDSAADRICIHQFDPRGWKKMTWIATTLASESTIYVYGRWCN